MKYITIFFLCACGLTACSSLVEDLNENPNAPTTTSYQYILTGAELGNTGLQTGETARKAGRVRAVSDRVEDLDAERRVVLGCIVDDPGFATEGVGCV